MSEPNYLSILQQAANSPLKKRLNSPPAPEKVVNALLEAEKISKKNKLNFAYTQLLGTWQLKFITGTKKTRAKAGIVLGAGRYLPKFVTVQISYSDRLLTKSPENVRAGTVENVVRLGGFKLALEGPIKFLPKKNILAFDFTRIDVKFWGIKLYQGYIRGGKAKEEEFYREKLGKQAFFAYFLAKDDFIAARGKGGGLALWNADK